MKHGSEPQEGSERVRQRYKPVVRLRDIAPTGCFVSHQQQRAVVAVPEPGAGHRYQLKWRWRRIVFISGESLALESQSLSVFVSFQPKTEVTQPRVTPRNNKGHRRPEPRGRLRLRVYRRGQPRFNNTHARALNILAFLSRYIKEGCTLILDQL